MNEFDKAQFDSIDVWGDKDGTDPRTHKLINQIIVKAREVEENKPFENEERPIIVVCHSNNWATKLCYWLGSSVYAGALDILKENKGICDKGRIYIYLYDTLVLFCDYSGLKELLEEYYPSAIYVDNPITLFKLDDYLESIKIFGTDIIYF